MRRVINIIFNNRLVNAVMIFFGIEKAFKLIYNPYKNFKADITQKSELEIAGFSDNEFINKVLNNIHTHLSEVIKNNCPANGIIADIGCGPGNYLNDFYDRYRLIGIDLNQSMIDIASKRFPNAIFIKGDFLEINFQEKIDCFYCTGALQYYYPSQIDKIFEKAYNSLKTGGIFFINFPHATKKLDTQFPDLSYVSYSPLKIRESGEKRFDLIHDKHVLDDRTIDEYDTQPYENPVTKGQRTYMNSYTMVFKKN